MNVGGVDQRSNPIIRVIWRIIVLAAILFVPGWRLYASARLIVKGEADQLVYYRFTGYMLLAFALLLLVFLMGRFIYPHRLLSPDYRRRLVRTFRRFFRPPSDFWGNLRHMLDVGASAFFSLSYRLLQVGWRLSKQLIGFSAPLIQVRDGKVLPPMTVNSPVSGGAAVIDPDSAIVLESQWRKRLLTWWAPTQYPSPTPFRVSRVRNSGITFIKWNEKLSGVVSLRKQFRINLDARATTSDGIEVKARVFTLFTLGQPAAVPKVAYVGGVGPDHLRVIRINRDTGMITEIGPEDELDAQDRREIDLFSQGFIGSVGRNAELAPDDRGSEFPPYPIDENRILAALRFQGRDVADNKPKTWSDLPVAVATEVFHNLISQVAYDDFFMPGNPNPAIYPIRFEYKPRFVRKVKYLGVMSYQFICRHNKVAPYVQVNQPIERISEVRDLTGSKPLRDLGIKVIHAGFSDLMPDEKVKKQRLETWQAHWMKMAEVRMGQADYDAWQARSDGYAAAQRDIYRTLNGLLDTRGVSEEILILRLVQVLENYLADPTTRQLLPLVTEEILRGLRLRLIPEEDRFFP